MTYEGVHMNPDYIKGVNLGNWLVLEKSMRPASKPTAPNTSTNVTSPPSHHGG